MKKNLLITLLSFFITCFSLYSQERSRSAKTGKFVTKKYAEKHKSTTYTSKVKKSK